MILIPDGRSSSTSFSTFTAGVAIGFVIGISLKLDFVGLIFPFYTVLSSNQTLQAYKFLLLQSPPYFVRLTSTFSPPSTSLAVISYFFLQITEEDVEDSRCG